MGHMRALMWLKNTSSLLTCIKLREILRSNFEGLDVYKPRNKYHFFKVVFVEKATIKIW